MSEYNEANIQSNETQRIAQENERINNETIRITNEIERQAREDMRIENENNRIIKEAERIIAEEERVEQFEQFIQPIAGNEEERQANEQARIEAENERVTNEQSREGRLDNIEEEIQNVKDNYLPLSGGNMTGNILPSTDTLSLGSDANRWQNLYLYNNLNVSNGTNKTLMGSDAVACETKSLWIRGGTTVRGLTVDSDNLYFGSDGNGSWNLGSDTLRWRTLYLTNGVFVNNGTMAIEIKGNSVECMTNRLYLRGGVNPGGIWVNSDNHSLEPNNNNGQWDLGNSNNRWTTVYSVNALNASSDRSMKENIEYVKDNENLSYGDMYNFVKNDLELATYNFMGDDKEQMNFIAQDLMCNADGTDNIIGQMICKPVAVPSEEEIAEGKPYPTLSYDTGMYMSVLAGALKEAINEIEKLKEEINQLKRQ